MANKIANLLKKMTFFKKPRVMALSYDEMSQQGLRAVIAPEPSKARVSLKAPFAAIVNWVKPYNVPTLDFGAAKESSYEPKAMMSSQEGLSIDLGHVVIYEMEDKIGAVVPYLREFNISGALGLRATSQLAKSRMEVHQRMSADHVVTFGDEASKAILGQPIENRKMLLQQNLYRNANLPGAKPVQPDQDDVSFSSFSPPSITLG